MSPATVPAEPRTLHFPPGPTTAKLTLIGDALERRRQEREAVGTVEVPEGVRVTLEISSDELEVLSRLGTGDLDLVTVTDPAPGLGAALAPLGAVTLVLQGERQPGAIAELAGVREVTDVSFGMALDEDAAAEIAALTQLTSFRAHGEICSAVVAAACGLTGLTALIVKSDLPIADGLHALGELTGLERMFVGGPDIDDRFIAQIPSLPAVTVLSLHAELSGEGIASLARWPALEYLVIHSSSFDIRWLSGLADSPTLAMLILRGIPDIDDQAVPHLASLPLKEIHITAEGKTPDETFSLSAKVWLSRVRPDLSLNGFSATPKAVARYMAAGLGAHPVTGEMELAS